MTISAVIETRIARTPAEGPVGRLAVLDPVIEHRRVAAIGFMQGGRERIAAVMRT